MERIAGKSRTLLNPIPHYLACDDGLRHHVFGNTLARAGDRPLLAGVYWNDGHIVGSAVADDS